MAKPPNPFRPGNIVHPGMFAGRAAEISEIERVLRQTKAGNAEHFLIHGERGIGKSSLLLLMDYVAKGELPTLDDHTFFKFITVSLSLDAKMSAEDLIRRICIEIKHAVDAQEQLRVYAERTWDFIKRFEVMGVRYAVDDRGHHDSNLLPDLCNALERIATDTARDYDGLLLTLDEADRPSADAHLGSTLKTITEHLSRKGHNRVAIGLAGLDLAIDRLRESHASAPRILHSIALKPLTSVDCEEAVARGIKKANDDAASGALPRVDIDSEALARISQLSEGYPAFVQQFASSAFDANDDGMIDEKDVEDGARAPKGAFYQLGVKYFEHLYWDQIASDHYRAVLHAMSQNGTSWVSKKSIREATRIKESILTNALKALVTRNILVTRAGKRGEYRLPSESFAVWIREFTSEMPAANGKSG